MKAALIFAEMRGDTVTLGGNVAAHSVYKLWRAVRVAQLSDGDLIEASKMMGTDQLVTFARLIYATGMTSEEQP